MPSLESGSDTIFPFLILILMTEFCDEELAALFTSLSLFSCHPTDAQRTNLSLLSCASTGRLPFILVTLVKKNMLNCYSANKWCGIGSFESCMADSWSSIFGSNEGILASNVSNLFKKLNSILEVKGHLSCLKPCSPCDPPTYPYIWPWCPLFCVNSISD